MSDTDAAAVTEEKWAPDDPRWEEQYKDRIPYDGPVPTKHDTKPLPDAFGRSLDTLEKARQWLTNPHNWHESRLFILRWDGLLCTVNKEHGQRLVRERWDTGLPWCAVYEQRKRRSRGERGEAMEEADGAPVSSDELLAGLSS